MGIALGVQMTDDVYLVWCAPDGDDATASLIGVYTSEPLALARVERAKSLPSLATDLCDFRITRYALDEYEWARTT